ncbi:hypothetical protein H0H92_002160 [Tricholoma furcatifolium]|nr:hypothetical protein H0H92_002160 [Tricholoma furcatifolium]
MTHPNMRAVWTRIREENPFRTRASLETLTFQLSGSRLDVILSMDFPWYQVKFLTITWQVDDPLNPAMIVRALSKCRTLSKLDLCSRKTTFHDHQNARFNDNFTHKELLNFNSLINLDVSGGLPSSVIKSIATSEQLLTVTTWDAGIKVQCPSLTSFTIHNCTTKNTGLFVSIINFLERSSFARLQRLSFTSHEVDHSPNQQLLGDLLFALHPCIHLAIKGLRISEEHLERISSGLLLPGIQSLRLDVFDPYQAHLSMVERRLEFERGMGSINLRSIRGRVRDPSLLVDSSEASKNFITKVQQIKERYGVYFEYNFPGPWDDY